MGCHACINAKLELNNRRKNSPIKAPPLLIIITFRALIVMFGWNWFPPAGLAQHKVKKHSGCGRGALPAVLPEAREWGRARILRTLPNSARALAWCWTNVGGRMQVGGHS